MATLDIEGTRISEIEGRWAVLTSRSTANLGRQFAKCLRAERIPGSYGCGYFAWLDDAGGLAFDLSA